MGASTCRGGGGSAVPQLGQQEQWMKVADDVEQSGGQERCRTKVVQGEEGKGEGTLHSAR
jgi:hypothetical protein